MVHDLAGKGISDCQNMQAAMRMARKMAAGRIAQERK
jgi:4-hydroxy-L-threonine phosphate dehydrogenase PdxA